ncbi:MAG: sigma-70 family RNA polymerase sigma factor [Phycisphaerae bacterium]|nr:sigma-70 family RNA polymerase sigma factor [Phycisphaerae bacterium]
MVANTTNAPEAFFERKDARKRYIPDRRLRRPSASASAARIARQVEDVQADIPDLEEHDAFVALQTCAYRASPNSRRRAGNRPRERRIWAQRWKTIRDYLVHRNLGLVYSMIGRFETQDVDRDELRSEALFSLVRAVEGFNPWLGFRFSTYACNAVMRAMIHSVRKARRARSTAPVGHEDWLERPAKEESRSALHAERVNKALRENVGELTPREALVLSWRFPMDGGVGRTLGECGDAMGLSKERVRQIQKSALDKIRAVLESDPVLQ